MMKKILIIVFIHFFTFPVYSLESTDFLWANGQSRQKDFPLKGKIFTGIINFDSNYVYSFARPKDHSLIGSTNSGRVNEIQIQQIGLGGEISYEKIRGKFMTQFGMYSSMTPRNDASTNRGQWNLNDAYKYFLEANAGYQLTDNLSLDVGLFMSYVGLCSYYNYENWVYQMSYVSANTPWFFQGARFNHKISESIQTEYWIINGWQSYGQFNEMPGFGIKVQIRPYESFSFVTNNYYGYDTLGKENRLRIHSDTSVQYKYWDSPTYSIAKAAFSLTVDAGCEQGDGVNCSNQYFLGIMLYNRIWAKNEKIAFTLGGGMIKNPGRYLVLLPPINGATASSGSYYFSTDPGSRFMAWDSSLTFDYMPAQSITFRSEYVHRQANVPYFAARGGITPNGGNQGTPGSYVPGFIPDLSSHENRIVFSMLVRL